MDEITVGSIVFYNDQHESWMTNLVTEVLKDYGDGTVEIATRRLTARVSKSKLTRLPVDIIFPIYNVSKYKPRCTSPD